MTSHVSPQDLIEARSADATMAWVSEEVEQLLIRDLLYVFQAS